MLDAIAEVLRADGGIITEVSRGVAIGPSAEVLEHLRKIPMVERDEGLDVVLQQLVDDAIVKIDALLIGLALSIRHDARPCERNARGIQPEVRHQRDVVAIAMVKIACDIAGIAVLDLVGRMREAIPDRLALAVLIVRALDLVRRARGAPQEVFRKRDRCHVIL